MYVNKKTGLVAVVGRGGRIYGVTPTQAIEGVNAGQLQLAKVPGDIETVRYNGPGAARTQDTPLLPGAAGSGEGQNIVSGVRTNFTADNGEGGNGNGAGNGEGTNADVEIPDKWEELHYMQRVSLAKKIKPDFDVPKKEDLGEMPAGDYVDNFIRDEMSRRDAEAAPAQ